MTDPALERRVRRHVLGRVHDFFAIVPPGCEAIAGAELTALGIEAVAVEGPGGLAFRGRLEAAHRVLLAARTVGRVLMRVAGFEATRFDVLRKKAAAVPWELFLPVDAPLGLKVSASRSRLIHTGRIAAELAAAIADRLAPLGRAPRFVARADDDGGEGAEVQRIFARFDDDRCQLSLDACGELLHHRGFPKQVGPAPLRETLAATILLAAGLDGYDHLLDPMSGSGTFALEAARLATTGLAGGPRRFACESWPAHRAPAFAHLRRTLGGRPVMPGLGTLVASDRSPRAVARVLANVAAAGLTDRVRVEQRDLLASPPPLPPGRVLVVLNPPYGARLSDAAAVTALYRSLGALLRGPYARAGVAVLVPAARLEQALALSPDLRLPLVHGGLPVTLLVRHGAGRAAAGR